MARVKLTILHDKDDAGDGVVVVVDGTSHQLGQGVSQDFVVMQGLHINLTAVTEQGKPLGDRIEPAPASASPGDNIAKSLTDPRGSEGGGGQPGGNKTVTGGGSSPLQSNVDKDGDKVVDGQDAGGNSPPQGSGATPPQLTPEQRKAQEAKAAADIKEGQQQKADAAAAAKK